MSSRSLFDWADEQAIPETKVIDFRSRRERLRRWQWLEENDPFRNLDLIIDRQDGRAPALEIYQFHHRHPAAPGAYQPEPTRRQG